MSQRILVAPARVYGEIGASPVEANVVCHAFVEAVFANGACNIPAGTMKQVKLIDARAQLTLAWYSRLPLGGSGK